MTQEGKNKNQISFKPYSSNFTKEKVKHKETKLIFEDEYLEYTIQYQQKVLAEIPVENEASKLFNEDPETIKEERIEKIFDSGRVNKSSVNMVYRENENMHTPEGIEIVPTLTITSSGSDVCFSFSDENLRDEVLDKIYKWKWNK